MKTNLLPGLKLSVVLLLLCSVVYPLVVAALSRLAPGQGNGVTISQNGKVVGYENIGQLFTRPEYFHGRPSAVNYNAAGSGGSNKGPANPEYLATVKARVDTILVHNPTVKLSEIPTELVTASGSGLDPHISIAAVNVQINRVAAVRHTTPVVIQNLVQQFTEKPLLGMFGPSKINVLKLNLALDQSMPVKQ